MIDLPSDRSMIQTRTLWEIYPFPKVRCRDYSLGRPGGVTMALPWANVYYGELISPVASLANGGG